MLFAAALSASGSARDLLLATDASGLELFTSNLVFEETSRNLRARYPSAVPAFDLFRAVFTGRLANPPLDMVEQVAQSITLKDAPIVAGAMQSRCFWLATYDRKHLLSSAELIQRKFGVTVATPGEVWEAIGKAKP